MGQGFIIRCRHCGHQFKRLYGCGFAISGTIYCNRCGKAKRYSGWDEYNAVLELACKCGGKYEDNAKGTCPACGVVLKEEGVDFDEQFYLLWD